MTKKEPVCDQVAVLPPLYWVLVTVIKKGAPPGEHDRFYVVLRSWQWLIVT